MASSRNLAKFLFPFFVFLISVENEVKSLKPETVDLIKEWAPILWLHPQEPFFPSNVDFYLENMEVNIY